MSKKISFIILSIIVLLTTSCEKSNVQSGTSSKLSYPSKIANSSDNVTPLSTVNGGKRVFTDEQIREIGYVHNQKVIDLVKKTHYDNVDIFSEFIKNSLEVEMDMLKIDATQIEIDDQYNSLFLKTYLSNEAYSLIYQVSEECAYANTIDDVVKLIGQAKKFTRKNFTGAEYDVVMIALTVFENSALLWFDKEVGGINLGYETANKYLTAQNAPMSKEERDRLQVALKKCLIADGIGAASATLTLLLHLDKLIAAGWGGLATALIDIGFGAAVASYMELGRIIIDKKYVVTPPTVVIKWNDQFSYYDPKIIYKL